MNFVHVLFGQKPSPRPPTLTEPPKDVRMHEVRAREAPAKRAWLAETDSRIDTEHGVLQARGGRDYVLAHAYLRRDKILDDPSVAASIASERTLFSATSP